MAVNARKISSSIILQVESGMAPDGSAVYSSRTISKIDPALSDDDAYNFATAVAGLQEYPLGDVQRSEKSVLTQA